MEKEKCIQIMMIQDKIIAAQQECVKKPACKVIHRITECCILGFLPEWRKCESCWS